MIEEERHPQAEERDPQAEEEHDPQAEVDALEDDPPQDLGEWPDGQAKYKTFGGPEGETSYEEGPTAKLGDYDVRHHEDGSVTVRGEKVDNPEDYKSDPIPGGPTDPDAPPLPGEDSVENDD
jgi:hypothetical protein